MTHGKLLLTGATIALIAALAIQAARAEDCPPNSGGCKVVVMTPQEVQSLEGPGLIFDSAIWANRANLQGAIDAWKQKIASSPDGIVKPAPEAKKQDRLPEGEK
jgi:hypothetical protein